MGVYRDKSVTKVGGVYDDSSGYGLQNEVR